ncbi:MAG: hypothetical protein GY861_04405 [bacterium]|nr:hypothetical protein [bacterium]
MKKAVWMVVRDDEFYIDMAIKSVIDFCDVYVLDTGSKDRTMEIIRSFDNKKHKVFLEEKDFGGNLRFEDCYREKDARNYAMARCLDVFDPEWLIQLDADEFYTEEYFHLIDTSVKDLKALSFGHSTHVLTTPTMISNDPADMSRWAIGKLFDPHVRSWKAGILVRWEHPEGRHVIPSFNGRDIPAYCATKRPVHFHLKYSFGPKSLYNFIVRLCDTGKKADGMFTDAEMSNMLQTQEYWMKNYPEYFNGGKFILPDDVLQELLGKSIPVDAKIPEYVIEKWNGWGTW